MMPSVYNISSVQRETIQNCYMNVTVGRTGLILAGAPAKRAGGAGAECAHPGRGRGAPAIVAAAMAATKRAPRRAPVVAMAKISELFSEREA